MAAIIPLACYAALVFAFVSYQRARHDCPDWRVAVVGAAVVWGVVVVALTEGLSLFRALRWGWVLGLWTLALLLTFGAGAAFTRHGRAWEPSLTLRRPKVAPFTLVCVAAIAVMLAVIGVICVVAAPGSTDNMTYHLARVAHWIEDGSVGDFPANIVRQLFDPPWSEYAVLQLQLLSGGDHLSNLVGWFSMAGSCVAVSLVARELGADQRGQALAAVVAATLPMGILHASTTLNDYPTAFWVICLVYYVLRLRARVTWPVILGAGVSLGLAIGTKATAYVFVAPLLVWYAVTHAQAAGWRVWRWSVLRPLVMIGVLALLLNTPLYVRNLAVFHNPLGPADNLYVNTSFAPPVLACNILKNASLEFSMPSGAANTLLLRAVRFSCTHLGIDPSNPGTNWAGGPFEVVYLPTSEGYAGNPLQSLLILVALALCVGLPGLRRRSALLQYAVVLVAAFLLFSLLLRWQVWGNRVLIAWFIMASPLCGAVLADIAARRSVLRLVAVNLVALVLVLGALPAVFANSDRPLVGARSIFVSPRATQYFINREYLHSEQGFAGGARTIESLGCTQVGFASDNDGWEYAAWAMFALDDWPVHAQDVLVHNASTRLGRSRPFASFRPCALFDMRPLASSPVPSHITLSDGQTFTPLWTRDDVTVYVPAPVAARVPHPIKTVTGKSTLGH